MNLMTPAQKALHTAKWARTMTKWLIKRSTKGGVKWQVFDFNGPSRQESRGIVDLLAIRKRHRPEDVKVPRGDLFEIVLVQVKGGSARTPSSEDIKRMLAVRDHHRAERAVLVEWKRGKVLKCYELSAEGPTPVAAEAVFGKIPTAASLAVEAAKVAEDLNAA